eukprot:gene11005-11159_t
MVIEKATPADDSSKKRKLPGSMAGQAAPVAPKSAVKKSGTARMELSAEGQAAVEAVEAAAAALPALDRDSLSFMAAAPGGFGGEQEETEPPNAGSKAVPRGHPDALSGKTFVFSGVLDSLFRDQARDLVLSHGGRVTGDVSGKTDFLALECAAKAAEKDAALKKDPKKAAKSAPVPFALECLAALAQPQPPAGTVLAFFVDVLYRLGTRVVERNDELWVDKYKPKGQSELVGNNTTIATLKQWLFQWEAVHLRGATPEQPKGAGGGKPKDMSKKAVLLAGPPGIGKTTSAHIIAKDLGFEVVEVNASDTRSKADSKAGTGMGGKLANVVREMVTSTALSVVGGPRRKQVLVMDEVDGMSAGDRGGVADLINTIKMSKIPIICICNDKYSQKLRSLRNHCLELDYRKPQVQQIAQRLHFVCQQEGLTVNDATLRTLVEGAQGDIRLVLGHLQMVRRRSQLLDYDSAKSMGANGKDADMSPFSATSKLFEQGRERNSVPISTADQMELVFADPDLVPLLVAENYINYKPDVAQNRPDWRFRCLAKAADAISAGDVVNHSVRRYGNWGLMPFGGLMGGVVPATYMRGYRETFEAHEQNFTRFSAWFGQNSHSAKQRRLLAELSCNMAAAECGASCSRNSVRLDYLPAFRQASGLVLTRPLAQQGEEGIPGVIQTMQEYCINREQYDYILDVTKFKSKGAWAEDPLKGIETKTKSAFTRTFNKQYMWRVDDLGVTGM